MNVQRAEDGTGNDRPGIGVGAPDAAHGGERSDRQDALVGERGVDRARSVAPLRCQDRVAARVEQYAARNDQPRGLAAGAARQDELAMAGPDGAHGEKPGSLGGSPFDHENGGVLAGVAVDAGEWIV